MKFGEALLYRKSLSKRQFCDSRLSDSHTLVSASHRPHLLSGLGETGCKQSLRLQKNRRGGGGREWNCTWVFVLKPSDVLRVKNALVGTVCRVTERTMCS
jgi:hypothetical protein